MKIMNSLTAISGANKRAKQSGLRRLPRPETYLSLFISLMSCGACLGFTRQLPPLPGDRRHHQKSLCSEDLDVAAEGSIDLSEPRSRYAETLLQASNSGCRMRYSIATVVPQCLEPPHALFPCVCSAALQQSARATIKLTGKAQRSSRTIPAWNSPTEFCLNCAVR
jgi:hypothetical protein